MSGETVSSTEVVDIYVPLRNEGTDVVRPTKAIPLGQMKYRVLSVPNYETLLEEWAFPPGTTVECRTETREGKQVLVARREA